MRVNRTPSRRLAFINVVLYIACLAGASALWAGALRAAIIGLREPVSYQPLLPLVWVPLAGLVVLFVVVAIAVSRALGGEKPSRWASGGVYLVSGALVLWRVAGPNPMAPQPAEAYAAAARYLEALEAGLEEHYRAQARYPEDAASLPAGAAKDSPWHSHGKLLPFHVVSENGMGGRLVGREGDSAGTAYYVVSHSGERFWMTIVVLVGAPTGHLDFLRDTQGTPLVVSSPSHTQ